MWREVTFLIASLAPSLPLYTNKEVSQQNISLSWIMVNEGTFLPCSKYTIKQQTKKMESTMFENNKNQNNPSLSTTEENKHTGRNQNAKGWSVSRQRMDKNMFGNQQYSPKVGFPIASQAEKIFNLPLAFIIQSHNLRIFI